MPDLFWEFLFYSIITINDISKIRSQIVFYTFPTDAFVYVLIVEISLLITNRAT